MPEMHYWLLFFFVTVKDDESSITNMILGLKWQKNSDLTKMDGSQKFLKFQTGIHLFWPVKMLIELIFGWILTKIWPRGRKGKQMNCRLISMHFYSEGRTYWFVWTLDLTKSSNLIECGDRYNVSGLTDTVALDSWFEWWCKKIRKFECNRLEFQVHLHETKVV